MILEGILTTENQDGSMHLAPMGPEVDRDRHSWTLKPFQTSTTFANLRRDRRAIFHVVDDSLLLAKAVLGRAQRSPATRVEPFGYVLSEACEWFALKIVELNESEDRAVAAAECLEQKSIRPFFGWNRAKHAVVEAAILASRCRWLELSLLEASLSPLAVIVGKTAGDQEREAFEMLVDHIEKVMHERRQA